MCFNWRLFDSVTACFASKQISAIENSSVKRCTLASSIKQSNGSLVFKRAILELASGAGTYILSNLLLIRCPTFCGWQVEASTAQKSGLEWSLMISSIWIYFLLVSSCSKYSSSSMSSRKIREGFCFYYKTKVCFMISIASVGENIVIRSLQFKLSIGSPTEFTIAANSEDFPHPLAP